MELKKMREMSEAELNAELIKMEKGSFQPQIQHVTGQLENPVKMRETKRDIARVKTIIREKELARAQGYGKEDVLWQLRETEERQESAW